MRKRLLGSALLIAASTLVAIGLGEVALRAIDYSSPVWYRPDPVLGWTLRPGLESWYTSEGRGFVKVNANGMRDRDHEFEKPKNVYRIVVLGDSYSEARQVAEEQTFWALLPDRLQRCGFQPGKKIEVLNFGTSGFGTAQEYVQLETQALGYRPDLVLLQFTNGNDVRNNSFVLEDEKNRPFFRLSGDGKLQRDDSFVRTEGFKKQASVRNELLRVASDYSRVLQLVRSVQSASLMRKAHAEGGVEQGLEPQVLAAPREPRWEEAWRITLALIAQTANLAERNGARFLVFTVPYAIQVHPDRQLRAAEQAKLGVGDLFYPDRRIADFAKTHGIDALPLAPQMQRLAESQQIHYHGFPKTGMGRGHWNPEGHRVAAQLIARHLCAAAS